MLPIAWSNYDTSTNRSHKLKHHVNRAVMHLWNEISFFLFHKHKQSQTQTLKIVFILLFSSECFDSLKFLATKHISHTFSNTSNIMWHFRGSWRSFRSVTTYQKGGRNILPPIRTFSDWFKQNSTSRGTFERMGWAVNVTKCHKMSHGSKEAFKIQHFFRQSISKKKSFLVVNYTSVELKCVTSRLNSDPGGLRLHKCLYRSTTRRQKV